MSNFNNSKRVKLSAIESGIKPEDGGEASAVEQKAPIAGCSHSANRKTPEDASETATVIATSDSATGSDLVEDVLMHIFDTDVLDTADLLNFRLVNRLWRNCATSVLLKSGDCQISLDSCYVSDPSTDTDGRQYDYCNNNNKDSLLEDLIEIISQSPKFPCFVFSFILFDTAVRKNRIDTSSLPKFFSLYGNNVKSVTMCGPILQNDLRSLLLNYTPFLECLDLQYWHSVRYRFREHCVFNQPVFPQSTTFPNLKTLVLGPCTDFNLIELVDAAINLESIENTNFSSLKHLLDHGKVGLIKKLEYYLHVVDWEVFQAFEKLAESQPALMKLIVTPVRYSHENTCDVLHVTFYKRTQMFLNRIVESSKDTLKYLEFHICPFGDIEFPILPNLECLKLVQSKDQERGEFNTSPSSNPMVLQFEHGEEGQLGTRREDQNLELSSKVDARIKGLCPNRPCNSFPNLKKLQLDIKNYDVGRDGSLLLLRTCQSHNRKIVPHVYESLKVLEIYSALPKTFEEAQRASDLFRSVTILKVKISKVQELNCSLWVLCPLVKFIEIYGLSNHANTQPVPCFAKVVDSDDESSCDDNEPVSGDACGDDSDAIGLVDSFFTGFSISLCKKLKEVNQFPMEIEGSPSLMNFFRVRPSMYDLKGLTDFKIVFMCLEATFASRVTEVYAFQTMPKTNIILAHSSSNKCNEAECELKKYLAPISTFVHFDHRNIPERFK